jgi:RNA-dependent RNA polymerase
VFLPQDIIEFFARNMVNENLGAICNAFVVHADSNEYGAVDENCITLAVDFPKTGHGIKSALMMGS